jgi:hypothetical protein
MCSISPCVDIAHRRELLSETHAQGTLENARNVCSQHHNRRELCHAFDAKITPELLAAGSQLLCCFPNKQGTSGSLISCSNDVGARVQFVVLLAEPHLLFVIFYEVAQMHLVDLFTSR